MTCGGRRGPHPSGRLAGGSSQGEKVRNLKKSGADKATIDAEVAQLKALKLEVEELVCPRASERPVAVGRLRSTGSAPSRGAASPTGSGPPI